MNLSPDQQLRIQEVVKDILLSRLETFPDDTTLVRNAPFHDAFLQAFQKRMQSVNIKPAYLVAIASWMHGLNTSLGSGFENIAHILSGGYKRKFTQQFTLKVSQGQATAIHGIITELKLGSRTPNLPVEDEAIMISTNTGIVLQEGLGFTADNYLESERTIECIELKSVRPNSGEGRGEKEKILYAKAALKRLNPTKSVKFYVGFPFDPTSDTHTGFDKNRFMDHLIEFKKFFAPDEILISSELWDHLSGKNNTMDELLEIVTKTAIEVQAKP